MSSTINLRTWMPECPIDAEPAVCEIIPCGHFISLNSARMYAQNIRNRNLVSNPYSCPLCRRRWTEIRCLSVDKTHEKIKERLDENTRNIPNGPLKIWFEQILHFFTTRNVIDEELKQLIGACLTKAFIKRSNGSSSSDNIVVSNNKENIIQVIQCVKDAIKEYITRNFGNNKNKAIEENRRLVGDQEYEQSPLKWILQDSETAANAAIEQARGIRLPERREVISVESVFSKIRRSLGVVANEAPRQIPSELATIILSTSALLGAARMYSNIDSSVCEGLSDTPIPGPIVPLRGHWENFAVCTSSMDGNYCCDPMESALGDGACGTTQYHTGDGKNIYQGPEIEYSKKSAMAPGGYYSCEMNPLLGECIAEAAIQNGICALVGDEDCDVPKGTGWAQADNARFKVTETGPGPNLPSEHAQCNNEISNQETLALGAAIVSVGVLVYGIYKACVGFSYPQQEVLTGDDTLVITPDGRELRGGNKKRKSSKRKSIKNKKKRKSRGRKKKTHKSNKRIRRKKTRVKKRNKRIRRKKVTFKTKK